MSDEAIRIARGLGGEVEVDGPVDAFAASVLKRAGFDRYPTPRAVWIRLPFHLGTPGRTNTPTWAAEMLTAARCGVDLDPDLRPWQCRSAGAATSAPPPPAQTPRRRYWPRYLTLKPTVRLHSMSPTDRPDGARGARGARGAMSGARSTALPHRVMRTGWRSLVGAHDAVRSKAAA
ncbi:hypothetical protein [Streptomyces sp. BA2]|uniref:hypothetical protein n=1 Tax=Streptomyces sp. BA2 TaxID=436595 RepID=UPI00192077FC|nr:hypothetical protein [Streptomyces sp. BA2]